MTPDHALAILRSQVSTYRFDRLGSEQSLTSRMLAEDALAALADVLDVPREGRAA